MYDSVDVSTIPDNPEAVAGYVGGSWPNYTTLVAKFPKAHHLSIAPQATMDAECLDVEPFDATNDQVVGWYNRQKARGVAVPVIYTSASNLQALIDVLSAAGVPRSHYRLWSAHYTFSAHVCGPATCGYPQADATQWTNKSMGRNLDESLCSEAFFGPPPPPPDPHHYHRFAKGPFASRWGPLHERELVEEYDRERKHPVFDHKKLKALEEKLRFLADRIYALAHEQLVHGKPSWDKYDRGWRYQELHHRAEGHRVSS